MSEPTTYHYDEQGRVVPMQPLPPPEPVPVPAPYYWEDGGNEDLPVHLKIGQTLHWAGTGVLGGMEAVGEVVADLLGLNQSKFQWIIDMKEREEERAAEKARRRAAASRERTNRESDALESGVGSPPARANAASKDE